ncbi:Alcohol dehydrogenase superfamily, zinc-type [Parasponia andersonii]|uniref:Alcohol dehydrogenase superfamily, zinc-type n=1 Tax=Parasponia andersonii TaxID=3476 RepID=A0A2P5C347_PARAD|nr:Alcohol dehydrogenase superfamily, zinc-type [Parasponia andersonii]
MGVVENRQVIFRDYIETIPKETDMVLKVSQIEIEIEIEVNPPKGSGQILLRNLYLSCDPYMRGRMRNFHASYIPPFVPGQPLTGYGVSQVVNSDSPDFKPGDYVTGITGWEQYSLVRPTQQQHLRKIRPDDDIPLSFHLGLLGMPGFTAYAGFFEVCIPKKGEYVFISAASGAVGQLVGQLAKLHGCYVVGSAGTTQKVDLLKNKLGFNEAFNYKHEPNLDATLKRYFPQGIDIYFDNVGGDMLDAALGNMRVFGRVAACGMVSLHSLSDPQKLHNLYNLIPKRIKIQGFLQSDYLESFPRFLEHVTSYYRQGKIVYIEDMNEGLEIAPSALVGLFSGKNVGKQVIRVAHQ